MGKTALLVTALCFCTVCLCDTGNDSLENDGGINTPKTDIVSQAEDKKPVQSQEIERGQGGEEGTGSPDDPEPTSPLSDFENSYNYVLSRLHSMDQAIHKLNVGHYTLDVRLVQLLDRLSRLDAKIGEMDDEIQQVLALAKENRKEIGQLEGCQKGRRVGHKCFLVYRSYETYAGASRNCQERGGRMAMPRDRKEQEALADYTRGFFHPGNWPIWLGINDLRSEGLYLFEDNTRVTYFQWRKHYLSSQPDGGKRENCVAISSDDGDWWDNYCDRRMFYLCEFDA
ncbi:C-type lectin domain family 11 member A [Brienomyrus brachyistius]|uniref:C-type lectin domain family 11 member A n=1 Tax=Brienomyrus brachyistius TaxID=42636 RepID=UPI0020B3868C|nr:C-type lectin domain family 11 member A [Brienomyrus brachyistius]